MREFNLKTPVDVAKEANKTKYSFDNKEQKSGLFVFISERIKALFLSIKL